MDKNRKCICKSSHSKVMSVQPGITGYWQVHGRSETDFSERIEMTEYYIDHQGIKLDLQILFDT